MAVCPPGEFAYSKPAVLKIVRYENRKFYCTHKSAYINRKQLIDLVKNYQRFQVIEYATEQDITQKTLISLLSELDWSEAEVNELIRNKQKN